MNLGMCVDEEGCTQTVPYASNIGPNKIATTKIATCSEEEIYKGRIVDVNNCPTPDDFGFTVIIGNWAEFNGEPEPSEWPFDQDCEFGFNQRGKYAFWVRYALYADYLIAPPLWMLQVTMRTDISETHLVRLRQALGVHMVTTHPLLCSLQINPLVGVNVSGRLVAFINGTWCGISIGSVNLKVDSFFRPTPYGIERMPQHPLEIYNKLEKINLGLKAYNSKLYSRYSQKLLSYKMALPTYLWNRPSEVWECVFRRSVYNKKSFNVSDYVEPVFKTRDEYFVGENKGAHEFQQVAKQWKLKIVFGNYIVQLILEVDATQLTIESFDIDIVYAVKDAISNQLKAPGNDVVIDAGWFQREIRLYQQNHQEFCSHSSDHLAKQRDEWRKVTSKLPL